MNNKRMSGGRIVVAMILGGLAILAAQHGLGHSEGLALLCTAPVIVPETAGAQVREWIRNLYTAHITSLNGIMDKLPENVRAEMQKLRDGLNEKLSALPPIEQVAGAQKAGWALECLADAMERMQAYASGVMDRLTSMANEYNGKVTALNSLQKRVTDGDLLEKDKVKELVDAGRDEAKKALAPAMRKLRQSAIELAGLPAPGEAILDLAEADYETRFNEAKANVEALSKKGLTLKGKGKAWVEKTAWLAAQEFAGQMKTIEELLPSAGAAGGAGSGGAAGAHPLLGNQGGADNNNASERICLC